jgi:hypothetical protein
MEIFFKGHVNTPALFEPATVVWSLGSRFLAATLWAKALGN